MLTTRRWQRYYWEHNTRSLNVQIICGKQLRDILKRRISIILGVKRPFCQPADFILFFSPSHSYKLHCETAATELGGERHEAITNELV